MAYDKSDHFDGSRFFNPGVKVEKGLFDVLKWQLAGGKAEWPESVANTAVPKIAETVPPGQIHVTWVNHASHLLQFSSKEKGSFNVITDPVFSKRVSPVTWAGPARVRPPGVAFEALPKIEVVLVSHNHYDHMDLDSLERLAKTFDPLFVVPLGNKAILNDIGITKVVELDWWQSHDLPGGEKITVAQAQHWSSRSMIDRNKALWGAFVVTGSDGLKAYFGGDTGYGGHFAEAKKRYGPMDVSLLPIGAYEPRWFMEKQHMNPADAVQAHLDLESRLSLGSHHSCFQLTDEAIGDPAKHLTEALAEKKVEPAKFQAPETGATVVYSKN